MSRNDSTGRTDADLLDEPGETLQRLRDAEAQGNPDDAGTAQALLGSLRAQMDAQEHSPRNRWQRRSLGVRVTACLGAAAAALAAVVLATPRPDLHAYPRGRLLAVLAVLAVACVPLARGALRPWHRRAPTTARALGSAAAALGLALAAALLPVAHTLLPHTAAPHGEALWQHAGRCLLFGSAIGVPVFALTRWASRDAPGGAWLAAAFGGLVGYLALQLHCPITERAHLLAGHVTVGVAVLVVTAVLGAGARMRARRG